MIRTEANKDFRLSQIEALRPDEIADFVQALADHQGWALKAVEAKSADGPFDRLAAYWSASSGQVRRSIADGLCCFLDERPSEDEALD